MGDLPGTLTREGFMLLATTAGPVSARAISSAAPNT